MRKMEHRSRSRRSHGNDATGRSAEPHSLARTCEGSLVKLCESLVASTGAVDREFFLISELCELSQSSSRLSEIDLEPVLRRTDALVHLGEVENDFDSFFSPKMRKMEHSRRSPWSRWSRWSHGNDATGCSKGAWSLTASPGPAKDHLSSSVNLLQRPLEPLIENSF